MRLSASALSEGGNSLDESIGLITAANEVVNDPSSVGTALKTLTLRLRGSKTELEEMGEDVTDMATTTSQLQAKLLALTGGQVDIMLDPNTFKNSTQILREMAEAWEDMNDIQRASALELMGGKRQANTLSALIQNFDTVEKVIETSANSAGSALKENERYLDSIQGKIDQFNNALQSMWSGTLDSDLVKWFVNLGTELVKVVDTLGLIPSILLSIGSFKILQSLFKGTDIIGFIKSIGALTMGTKVFEAETRKASFALIGETINTKLAGSALVEYAVKMKLAEAADISKMTTTQLLGLSFKALGVAILDATKAVLAFLFTNPVGWIILAIGAIAGGIAIFNHFHKTTEELTEELNELKNELRDIQSELESVNSELKTTEERITELLAKDSLTFTEKEELDNLRKQNDELQRKIDLLELEEQQKKKESSSKFVQTMKKDLESTNEWIWANEVNWGDEGQFGGHVVGYDENGENIYGNERIYLDQTLDKYRQYQKEVAEIEAQIIDVGGSDTKEGKKLTKQKKKIDKWLKETEEYLGEKVATFNENSKDLDYFIGPDLTDEEKEFNEWLDYVKNFEDAWAISLGGTNAKTNAITRIFNKDDYAPISSAIDGYVKALKNGDKNAKTSIENIIKNNVDLVEDIESSGLSIDDAVSSFTSFTSELNFSTLEGKVAEMQLATSKMKTLLSDDDMFYSYSSFMKLFDIETGEVSTTAIAEYFQGTSEATRAEVAKLIQDIYDDKISIEDALKQFEYFGVESTLDIYVNEIQTNFKDVFVEFDDTDGLIDTFEELGKAIGSTADALKTFNKAEAEMANSGRVSIETALQLMEYTDDYGSILQVVDGKLQLVDNAEEVLIQTRIDAIKTSAQASLEAAESAYGKAREAVVNYQTALSTDKSAEVVATAWQKVLAAGSGLQAGIDALLSGGSWTDAYNSAYDSALSKMTGYEISYNDAGLQALVDAEAEAETAMKAAQDRVNLANQLTSETLETINDADDVDTVKDVEDKRFQMAMEYWDNRIKANEARYNQLQNEIDLLESKGQKASTEYYQEQIGLLQEFNDKGVLVGGTMHLLAQKRSEAYTYLKSLEEGSEEWWEVAHVINSIESEIDEVTASVVDLQDAMAETEWYKYEEFGNRLDDITSKLETIRDLIAPNGEENWFDDLGQWTEDGVAVLGTYIQELETYRSGLKETEDELDKYDKAYSEKTKNYYASLGIHSEQEYYDKVQELTEEQYEYLKLISDTEQSVVDMYESNVDAVEEYTDKLVDSYHDYIDNVKEALDAERDLYEFKKNVQKQTKDIASLERRIASLSGSTNASDIAERRRLEADLYGAREELDDTYYDHAKQTQQDALDKEAEAYEETMTRFIEGMRASLAEATLDMESFLNSVTIAVSMNADTVLEKYKATGVELSPELTNPWEVAKEAVGNYGAEALDLINKWTEDGYWNDFTTKVGKELSSPWSAGSDAAGAFEDAVNTVMSKVVSNISTNVKTASEEISEIYNQILDTEKRAKEADFSTGDGGGGNLKTETPTGHKITEPIVVTQLRALMKTSKETILGSKDFVDKNTEIINGVKYYKDSKTGYYYKISDLNSNRKYDGGRSTGWAIPKGTWFYTKNAKGTTGTKQDEWGITDEPWLGDELVLIPTPQGNLSYMRKGTGVVPADLTANLMEWGKFDPSSMNLGGGVNVNMINNAVNKPEFNLSVDNFLRCDNVSQDSLPELKQFVKEQMNSLVKQMNYSLKKSGAR